MQNALSKRPISDPLRPLLLFDVALGQLHRYRLSIQRDDLHKAIFHFTGSILLSWKQHGPTVLQALFYLSIALFWRSNTYKQPDDAIYATHYLFHLRDQPHAIPDVPRYYVTTALVDALASKVKWESGNVMQNIREMAVLSRELFTLEMLSDDEANRLINVICELLDSKILPRGSDQSLDELIECLRAARKYKPDLLESRFPLAVSLGFRYAMTRVNDDYEEAVSILDEIIADNLPGNSQDESVARTRGRAAGFATWLAMIRSTTYLSPEYLEEAIYRARTSFSSSKEHYPSMVVDPEVAAEPRFFYFGSVEGVEESSMNSPFNSPLSQPGPEVLKFHQAANKMESLHFAIRNCDDATKIDEAIEKGRSILSSSPDPPILDLFGNIQFQAFERTMKIEYLNESISVRRQAKESALPHPVPYRTSIPLFQSLLARLHFFPSYCTQDLNEVMELLSQIASDVHAITPLRFRYAFFWALLARRSRHFSISTAYETALRSEERRVGKEC